MSIRQEDILKHILLQEFERMQPDISTFEDDPMQFILRKYPGLNETLTYLMTPSFQDYLTGVYIMAPKPTTFKIVLHNGQFFFLQFTGKTYQATVAGKNYYLMSIGEKERCMLAIARLLRFGSPLKTKGPEGAEQGTRDAEGSESAGGETGGGEEAAPEAGAEEEPIAEAKILEEILKKSLVEADQQKKSRFTTKYETEALIDLDNHIKEIIKEVPNGSITIRVGGKDYPDITGAVNQPGTQPKSDFNLVNSSNNPTVFISHKKTGEEKAFPRWGSFQYLYKQKNEEVQKFVNNIKTYLIQIGRISASDNDNLFFVSKDKFSQKIADDKLKNMLVFGKEYGKNNFSINNVQIVIQGKVILEKVSGDNESPIYELKGEPGKFWINGKLPTGNYEPVLHVHWREGAYELDIRDCETMARPIGSLPAAEILWNANEVLDPKVKYVPKVRKKEVEIDRDNYVSSKSGGAASKIWIDKNPKYQKYFNLSGSPIRLPKGIFYPLNTDSKIQLVVPSTTKED